MDAAPDSVVRKRRRESLISPVLPDASQPPRVGECPAMQVLRHGPSAGSAWITEAIEMPRRGARASREVQTRREGGRGFLVIHRGHCQALRVQAADIIRGVATRHGRASPLCRCPPQSRHSETCSARAGATRSCCCHCGRCCWGLDFRLSITRRHLSTAWSSRRRDVAMRMKGHQPRGVLLGVT